jgi:hypothetical protein
MKIKELLKSLIETQKQINESLRDLREDLKLQTSTWAKTTMAVDRLDTCITSNVYNKEQTVDTINKEYDYRKDFEICQNENHALLELIKKYCKYNDKYEVIELFKTIKLKYDVKEK